MPGISQQAATVLHFAGVLQAAHPQDLYEILIGWIRSHPAPVIMHCEDVELEGSLATARLVQALHRLAATGHTTALVAAPHLLSHNLYRTGALQTGVLTLIAPREEEPYG